MMLRFFVVLSLLGSILTIKVPVPQNKENSTDVNPQHEGSLSKRPIYYESDETDVDSYLVPPNPHKYEESAYSEVIATPATYLLPPLPDAKAEYYAPTESAAQTDWYPIIKDASTSKESNEDDNNNQDESGETETDPPKKKFNKKIDVPTSNIRIPSRQLEPPSSKEYDRQYFVLPPATNLELPLVNTKHKFVVPTPVSELQLPLLEPIRKIQPFLKVPLQFKVVEPTLALDLVPPQPGFPNKYKNPTKLYPKKYATSFKPIPIPLNQFSEDSKEVPIAKPIKPFKPIYSSEEELPLDEKKIYLYEQSALKKLNQNPQEVQKYEEEVEEGDAELPYSEEAPEQHASETGYRHPRPIHQPAPVKQEEEPATSPAPNDRTEFRVHGMKGPHSYQFGYDTGKGKNRQFRYEERDNDGHVKGHYGYVDRSGKLRVVNYDAHPEHGFHAEAPQ